MQTEPKLNDTAEQLRNLAILVLDPTEADELRRRADELDAEPHAIEPATDSPS